MSSFGLPAARRPRVDAQRNVATILRAAVEVLGRNPEAGMDEIAVAAGVARQTVYAHFRSRQALLDAVVARITAEVVAALDAVDLDEGPAATALRRWLETAWGLVHRYPFLLSAAMPTASHEPVTGRLLRLVRRGQRTGEFDRGPTPEWLTAATIALGHAAGQEVAAGRMSTQAAGAAFATAAARVCGVLPEIR